MARNLPSFAYRLPPQHCGDFMGGLSFEYLPKHLEGSWSKCLESRVTSLLLAWGWPCAGMGQCQLVFSDIVCGLLCSLDNHVIESNL